jgi:hypothetical protein
MSSDDDSPGRVTEYTSLIDARAAVVSTRAVIAALSEGVGWKGVLSTS